MSEHDAANKIMGVITEYGRGMIDDDYEYIASEDAVERIIAIVRESLLDPEVIAVGGRGCPAPVQVKRVVENVLDATGFGESNG